MAHPTRKTSSQPLANSQTQWQHLKLCYCQLVWCLSIIFSTAKSIPSTLSWPLLPRHQQHSTLVPLLSCVSPGEFGKLMGNIEKPPPVLWIPFHPTSWRSVSWFNLISLAEPPRGMNKVFCLSPWSPPLLISNIINSSLSSGSVPQTFKTAADTHPQINLL